jgi:hypothetical protein
VSASTTCSFSNSAQPAPSLCAHGSGICRMPSPPAAAAALAAVLARRGAFWRSMCRTARSC